MKAFKIILIVVAALSFMSIGAGVYAEFAPAKIVNYDVVKTEYIKEPIFVGVNTTLYVPYEVIKEVEVPHVITINNTIIKEVYTQELKYPETYGELLKLFYSIQTAPDDCDDLAEYGRREAEKQGYYLGEVVLSGLEYNKIFLNHPIPMADYHALNFTWVGNYGYYIDFMVRDIKLAPEFVRD